MALFKYDRFLAPSPAKAFDMVFEAHEPAPFEGIYRCIVCGREAAIPQGYEFPADHSHTTERGYWRWQLVAYADHEPAGDRRRSLQALAATESPN
jgi:hypothetical protein